MRELNDATGISKTYPPPVAKRVKDVDYAVLRNPMIITGSTKDMYRDTYNVEEMRGEYKTRTIPSVYRDTDYFSFLEARKESRFVAQAYPDDIISVRAEKGYVKGSFFETDDSGTVIYEEEDEMYIESPYIIVSGIHRERKQQGDTVMDYHSPLITGWKTNLSKDELFTMHKEVFDTILSQDRVRRN